MSDVEHCYMTAAQTVCVPPGDPMEPAYAASQEAYMGYPEPFVQPVPTTTVLDPDVEMECFLTAGQRPCYPVGSPEAEAAAEKEDAYNNIRFPTTTTSSVPDEKVEASATAGRTTTDSTAPDSTFAVAEVTAPDATTAVAEVPQPVTPTTTLPATGLDGAIIAVACIATVLGVAARRVGRR